MSTNQTTRRRLEFLEHLLAERDRKDAQREAEARDIAAKIAADKTAAQREAAKIAAAQAARRSAWVNHLLTTAPPGRPLDIAAIEAGIPIADDVWPPGTDLTMAAFTTTKIQQPKEVEGTLLGKLVKGDKL